MELANLLIHMVFFGSYYGRLWSSWSCIRFDIYVLPLAESILPLWDNFALWNCCFYRCQSAYWILKASFLTLLWHSPGNVAGKTSFLPSAFSAIIKFELWVLPKIFWPWECMLWSILKIFFLWKWWLYSFLNEDLYSIRDILYILKSKNPRGDISWDLKIVLIFI